MGYREVILGDAPMAYWRLGERTGTSAADETSHGYGGTYTGGYTLGAAGAIAGSADPAVALNGSTGHVALPALGSLSTWTVEAWVKRSGSQGSFTGLLCDAYGGLVNWGLFSNAFGADGTQVVGGYFDGAWRTAGPATLPDGAYAHVVCTCDGTTIRLYLSGEQAATGACGSTPTSSGVGGYIGADINGNGHFGGSVDEVAVYAAALSAATIRRHYSEGLASAGLKRPTRVRIA